MDVRNADSGLQTRPATAFRTKALLGLGLILISGSCVLVAVLTAVEEPRTSLVAQAPTSGLSAFKEKYSVTTHHTWRRGVPQTIEGRLSEPRNGREMDDVVYQFFEDNTEVFRIEDPRSVFVVDRRDKSDPSPWKIRFKQVHGELPVYGSHLRAVFSFEDILISITGRFFPGINVQTSPVISKEEARRIARDNGAVQGFGGLGRDEELLVYPTDSADYLAWRVSLSYKYAIWYEHYVDALTGRHIGRVRMSGPAIPLPEGTEIWDTSVLPSAEQDEIDLDRWRNRHNRGPKGDPNLKQPSSQLKIGEIKRRIRNADGSIVPFQQPRTIQLEPPPDGAIRPAEDYLNSDTATSKSQPPDEYN